MARRNEKKKKGGRSNDLSDRNQSVGNMQGTTQTGGQSSGGSRTYDRRDSFDEDLRQSGKRKSRG